jgi:flagellar L-ring protein FlgH
MSGQFSLFAYFGRVARLIVPAIISVALTACAQLPPSASQEAQLSPVGAGMGGGSGTIDEVTTSSVDLKSYPSAASQSLWDNRAATLFRDRRAATAGDIITVLVNVDDRAALNSQSSRSRNASAGLGIDASIDVLGVTGEGTGTFSANGSSQAAGEGSVRRSERINVSVAATVIDVLPNGNLLVSGLQEIRVTHEKRSLAVQGIIRPKDIAPDNTIRYDQMAEARIAYGGAGLTARMQEPRYIHQVFDRVSPF